MRFSFLKPLCLSALFIASLTLTSCLTIYRHFDFPEPGGTWAVGSRAVELRSEFRSEPYAAKPGQVRRWMIQIWYPANRQYLNHATPVLYGEEIKTVIGELGGAMGQGFAYLSDIPTTTYRDIQPARSAQPWPVVVFSPGNLSTRFQSMAQITSLVSRGYVVIGVDHPYTSGIVIFPDGSRIHSTDKKTEAYEAANYTVNAQLDIRVKDVRESLDYAARLNADPNSDFYELLDLDWVGATGHSLGGATVLQAAAEDRRIKAVFSQEGGVWGSVVNTGVQVPLLYFQAGKTLKATTNSESGIKADSSQGATANTAAAFVDFKQEFMGNLNRVFALSTSDRYYLSVDEFNHFSFSDAPLFSDYFSGLMGYRKSIELVNAYLQDFFDHYLTGHESSLLRQDQTNYPQVEFRKNSVRLFP